MFGRIWTVISVGFGVWSVMNTLKKMDESKSDILGEFYSTLSPEEKEQWKKFFGVPYMKAEVKPISMNLPTYRPTEVIVPTQVETIEAQV